MKKAYLFWKRVFDIAVSLIAICILLLPWALIAIMIKCQSPGPVLYRARRIGLDGQPFTLYKFRSMRVDSGAVRMTTLRGDDRIFPFGAFLRKSKLDETPQFINILKGQMSVIGPRPEDEENAAEIYLGAYEEILTVKPGLSSPASLYDYTHGELYESEYDYVRDFLPKKLDVELYYVQNRTAGYDLKVILRTVWTILMILGGKRDFPEPKEVEFCRQEAAVR